MELHINKPESYLQDSSLSGTATSDARYNGMDEHTMHTEPVIEDDKGEGDVSIDDVSMDDGDEDQGQRSQALEGLEAIALSFIRQLAEGMRAVTSKSGERQPKVVIELKKRGKAAGQGNSSMRRIAFPGRWHGPGSRHIAQLLTIVDALHEAIVDDLPVTKRDIYYRNTELFQNQSTVDRFIDDIAATLNVGRIDLNVRASGKGLFCGASLIIHLRREGTICGSDSMGCLIPDAGDISHFEVVRDIAWVLVVEKEAVFQTLCGLNFASGSSHTLGSGIIMTGKGYPDVATRQLLKTLSDNLPSHIPVVGLVDGDPYGLDILSVYKFGSASMQHEDHSLVAGRVDWLGLSMRDLEEFEVDRSALLAVTPHDEKKAKSLLARPDDRLPASWRVELEQMLESREKAEIEIICDVRRDKHGMHPLVKYLEWKIRHIDISV